jgi:NhaA family Na+:H+ antiporter
VNLNNLYRDFFNSEKAGGILLIVVTVISMILANSSFAGSYSSMWNYEFSGHSIVHWINDGLMSIFFLLIGLELSREVRMGELSNLKKAILPVFAAVGGMIIPAVLYLVFNYKTSTQSGAGIPMATDIAFAIGILSLLGSRVPLSLKIFLTALAVIDDLGAILVIAIFYTSQIDWLNLFISLGIFLVLFGIEKLNVKNLIPYIVGGIVMWYFMLHSGIHPTITGVLLAFTIPFEKEDTNSTAYKLQHFLHKPVAFFILPLFAAANTIIAIGPGLINSLSENESIGILSGLILGKPVGILLFSFLAVSIGFASLPDRVNWKSIFSVGFLGGIGFTMSIFITLLAFDNEHLINSSKLAILTASFVAGLIGFILLKLFLPKARSI